MTDTTPKRKSPGRPAMTSEPMVLVQGFHVPPDDATWFAGLPGKSKRERLAWLRERMQDFNAMNERSRAGFYATIEAEEHL